ncbi:MAG: radical SAM protein [Bacteroidales bacterium]|nr:radical SAM protein [Bacteroidales bacterium]
MRILLITPPLTGLNAPYPATTALKAYLCAHGHEAHQADLNIELADRVLSSSFLSNIGLEQHAAVIDAVKQFLRGANASLAPRIVNRTLLPEGPRFNQAEDLEWAYGVSGTTDKAIHLATLFIEDVADLVRERVDSHFDLVRYAEHLAESSPTFDALEHELKQPPSRLDELMLTLLRAHIDRHQPDMVCFTVPFPGCLYAALRCGAWLKASTQVKVELGGGYPNTEWRSLSDTRLFDYVDYITLDDGETPLLRIADGRPLVRTYTRETLIDGTQQVVWHAGDDLTQQELQASTECCPDFDELPLHLYLSLAETTNPMHRLWTFGRWNKLMMAHGCYWAKCAFCDTSIDYIARYHAPSAATVVDRMERIMAQTGQSGFHFVDEALPPRLLGEVADELVRRRLTVSFWGNIRFEKAYDEQLCNRLSEAGCIAVSGGLEVASDRLLRLMSKGVNIRQTVEACRHLVEAGIMVHTYLMYGFPTETLQETIDALETVRHLFDDGLVQSAFWHRYAMTCHSPSGRNPQQYGAQRVDLAPHPFCNNEVDWIPIDSRSKEAPQFPYDIDEVGNVLRIATYNYMNGLGLDRPARSWFRHLLRR